MKVSCGDFRNHIELSEKLKPKDVSLNSFKIILVGNVRKIIQILEDILTMVRNNLGCYRIILYF